MIVPRPERRPRQGLLSVTGHRKGQCAASLADAGRAPGWLTSSDLGPEPVD